MGVVGNPKSKVGAAGCGAEMGILTWRSPDLARTWACSGCRGPIYGAGTEGGCGKSYSVLESALES